MPLALEVQVDRQEAEVDVRLVRVPGCRRADGLLGAEDAEEPGHDLRGAALPALRVFAVGGHVEGVVPPSATRVGLVEMVMGRSLHPRAPRGIGWVPEPDPQGIRPIP